MANKLYVVGILLLWAGSMSWLVSQRILPTFFTGEAPPVGVLRQLEPVAWQLSVDGQPCGVAVLQAIGDGGGVTEVHSRVTLDRRAPPKAAPPWLAAIGETLESLSLDIRTRNVFDAMGRLSNFKMGVSIGNLMEEVVVLGRVHHGKLKLRVRAGFIDRRLEHDWPETGLLASELMPETKVLSVYVGRKWRKEVFSPFSPPSTPVEVLEAEVVEASKPTYEGETVRACLVEFRSPTAAGVSEEGRLRGTMLVSETGRVLRHETFFLGSRIVFDRLGDTRSALLAKDRLELDRRAAMTTPGKAVSIPTDAEPLKPNE